MAISPNDDLLAAAGADGTIRVWDLATEKPIAAFSEHAESSVVCIAFSPDSAWIASGTAEWFKKTPKKAQEPPAGAEKPKLIEPFPPGAFDFRLIPAEIKVWEARTGKLIRGWNLDAEYSAQRVVFGSTPESLAVALNLRKIRAALGKHLPVSQLKIFETRTGTAVVAIAPHSDPIDGLALDPRAKRIAAASQDRTVTVFEESTGKILHTLVGHAAPVRSVSFSHDGKRLASADSDGTVKLWDPATGVEVLHVGLAGQTLESIRFSPDGRTL
ncbi:MAG: WD40 repeat domain-containing protein, partial [Planctomycetes bacterium]|nr:WD40 repeat domain-containing protein [Planctomycetota bacterium]